MTNEITKIAFTLEPKHNMTINGNVFNADNEGKNFSLKGGDGSDITPTEVSQVVTDLAEALKAFAVGLTLQDAAFENAAKVMASMSGVATAMSVANDNVADVGKIGYVTKEGMQLFGISTDDRGQTTYHYTKRIGYMNWHKADKAIQELNQDPALIPVYGQASFPTNRTTKTNELKMLFENKAVLGITENWVHGEGHSDSKSCQLYCANGSQGVYCKEDYAAVFVVWRREYLII